ncbi:tetratricopeptide repeat protein [Streptomyces umbrinus]|uniref:tetratricopeptide repeat protein n=1 Tax=Streptomyces umbrinus TaxID=67370 RepID=UPI0033D38EB5
MEQYAAPRPPVVWPVRVGTLPQLASAFQPRPGLTMRIDRAGAGHTTAGLTQVLTGGGGVGKSQFAAACAHQALMAGTELVVWVNAAKTDQVVTGYATAALRVQAPGAEGQDAESDARAFLDWLAGTSRSWLVVLDDLTALDDISPWWPPPSPAGDGRVLVTTRRREAVLSGGGRAVIEVDTYTPAEALAYLCGRFTGAHMPHLLDHQAEEVGQELGRLPLALAHAAAYMINEDVPCTRYLELFADHQSGLETLLPRHADTEGYGRQVTAALLLALEAAQQCEPAGLAAPALRLAAHLDPAGHPEDLWTSALFTGYLTVHRTPLSASPDTAPPTRVSSEQGRAVLRLLHRYALLTRDPQGRHRAVRMHALTARAVRETSPRLDISAAVLSAADGLTDIWPQVDHTEPDLCAVLRANTETLAGHAGDELWQFGCHPVLSLAGRSLYNAGLFAAAVHHWRRLVADSERLLGEDQSGTLTARTSLVASYAAAGRTGEAITLGERVVADCERLLGEGHPDTLTARNNLAISYEDAGRTVEATRLLERVVADRERPLGEDHPDTLMAQYNLSTSYWEAGRTGEAITLLERVIVGYERLLGEDHLDALSARGSTVAFGVARELTRRSWADRRGLAARGSLAARGNLAVYYWEAGRMAEAIALGEQVVAGYGQLLGEDHLDTLGARTVLADFYRNAGRTGEAMPLLEQVAAGYERLLGEDHPDTLDARATLADFYRNAGRTAEAIALGERVVVDCERLRGEDHPDTLAVRSHLGVAYHKAGRTAEAITLLERVVVDCERLLGEDHPDTLAVRSHLGIAHHKAGRTAEAITLLEQVAADCERLLGEDHPHTLGARTVLADFYRNAGRTGETIALEERIVTDPG